ncbi:MAG: hypothetical protein V4717_01345 [Bacteroidota bacterium]
MKTTLLTVAILLIVQLAQSQKVGIGTTSPAYILDVNGRMRLRHVDANVTSGLWFNKANNTEGAFTGMVNDSTIGFFGNATVGNWRVGIDVKNAMLGIGNTDPTAPLSFDNNIGDRIDIYHASPTARYGIGLQSGVMQLYAAGVGNDIAFGYGSSGAFTENMRIKGNGNIGVGISNPTLAGMEVNKKVGAVNAIFGSNTTGIAIESASPGIGFNTYYNGGRKVINTGFGGLAGVDPFNGRFYIFSSPASASGQGTAVDIIERLSILPNGNVGIGNAAPTAPLAFDNNNGDKIDIYNASATVRYGIGLQPSLMQLYSGGVGDDIAFGYGGSSSFIERMRVRGNGNVGIGILPTEKFEIRTSLGAIGWKHSWGGGSLVSTAPTLLTPATIRSNSADVQLTTNTNIGLYIKNDGTMGAGVNNPNRQLDVAGRMRVRGTAGDIYNSAGIYLDGTTDIERSFIGTFSNDMMGLYGAGCGWAFLMNVNNGSVSIGTSAAAAGYKLNVAGKIIAEEVRVQLKTAWPDYVFDTNYQLQPLEQVSAFIKANNHLPGIPPAADVASSGIALGDMQTKMMEKIEELTLYVIQLKSEVETLKAKK